jgi:phosphoserine aminotransferase
VSIFYKKGGGGAPSLIAPSTVSTFRPLAFQHVSIYPLSFQILAHSFAFQKNSTPLFSCNSELLHKNTRGWGYSSPLELATRHSSPATSAILERQNESQPASVAANRQTKEETGPVTHATVSARTAKRVHNFNAGPGALPLPVLERIREELLDWRGTGMSVMEMSHRSPEFEGINAAAEQKLRNLLGISDDYAVIFVQGGGSMQFSMAPMNLCLPGKPVDVLHTGAWTAKAIVELKKGFLHHIAASTEAEKFARLPRRDEMKFSLDASYVHICTNNTIEGTQWTALPDAGRETSNAPLVADMSSDIASRPVDVNKFGLIFAGAQKNLGPSGVTVVIIRRDLAERADKNLPTLLQYRTHIKEKSLYHTPATFAVYIVGLVLEWIESEGGIQGMAKRNDAKAGLLYNTIESSGGFYSCPVEKSSRSKMNVVFRVAGGVGRSAAAQNMDSIEKKFADEAAAAGLVGTPGHRSVGGLRVSLYNAVEPAAVEALTSFMCEFQRTRG